MGSTSSGRIHKGIREFQTKIKEIHTHGKWERKAIFFTKSPCHTPPTNQRTPHPSSLRMNYLSSFHYGPKKVFMMTLMITQSHMTVISVAEMNNHKQIIMTRPRWTFPLKGGKEGGWGFTLMSPFSPTPSPLPPVDAILFYFSASIILFDQP